MIQDFDTNIVYLSKWLKNEYPDVFSNLTTVLKSHSVAFDLIPHTNDIWCRDYMPIQIYEDCFVCYKYYPDYLLKRKSDHKYITDAKNVCKKMNLKCKYTDIVIDGGNVVKVGNHIIMTEKVLAENRIYQPMALHKELENLFECEIIFLPWDKAEKYGHSDGILKPVDSDTVLMTNYHDYDKSVTTEILKRLKSKFNVETLAYDVKQKDKRSWAYINFLSIAGLIVVPQLNIEEDCQAVEQIQSYYPTQKVVQVDIEKLIPAGGGLNCITWCMKSNADHMYFLYLYNRFNNENELNLCPGMNFTDSEIKYLGKYDICKFAERFPNVAEYYMKCLSD